MRQLEAAGGRVPSLHSPWPHTPSQPRPRPRLYTANVRLDSCQAEYVDVDVRDRENVKSHLLITLYFLDEMMSERIIFLYSSEMHAINK